MDVRRMEEQTQNNEPLFRINIKQTAKKEAYFDVTCRGNTKEEVEQRLNEAVMIAKKKCAELNLQ